MTAVQMDEKLQQAYAELPKTLDAWKTLTVVPEELRAKPFPPVLNDAVLVAARGGVPKHTPTWIMRQAGRYLPEFRAVRAEHDFFAVCRTPGRAMEVTLQPIIRYGPLLDASIIFSDILVVPQAMGMDVQMVPGRGPVFGDPLRTPADMDKLVLRPDVHETLGYVFDALTLTRHALGGVVPLYGFAGAPWTLMAYMIEGGGSKTLSKAKAFLFTHREHAQKLLTAITDTLVDYLAAQVKAGAQLLQIFDSWAGELGPEAYKEHVLPHVLRLAKELRARVDVPMCAFLKGAPASVLRTLRESDYDVIQADWSLTPEEVRDVAGPKAVQGNMDPSYLFASPETITAEAHRMLRGFGPERGGYIANLGHGMYPDHTPEHLGAYLAAVKSYRA